MRERSRQSAQKQSGFTILELLLVVALISLVMAVVVLHLSGPHHAAAAEQAVGKWVMIDQQIRHRCRQFHRSAVLTFQLQSGSLNRPLFDRRKPSASTIPLPSGVRIDRYVSATKPDGMKDGEVFIRYSAPGQTDTYAVRLLGPGQHDTWLLILGVTGEVKRGFSEREIDEAMRLASF